MAVGVNKREIADYASLDEQPVRIICMLAARHDQHAQYLKTLGAVSGVLKTDAVRSALLGATDAGEAYAILTQ
jgi:PTS system nitrogen regulatory IIA component